jgi:outer membrane cobalamin receptor
MHLPDQTKKMGLIGAAVAAAMASMPARAQDATPSSNEEVDEVLVTARRRSETFKDVPITVNVFSKEAIESARHRATG